MRGIVAVPRPAVTHAVLAALVAAGAAPLVSIVGGSLPWADAHALVSNLTLTTDASGPDIGVLAEVRYPDHDPVIGETVVGVAYRPSDGTTRPLSVTPVPGRSGFYRGTVLLTPGGWQVEMDAIGKTRGLQSIGFTVQQTGAVTDVASPDPLPATVQLPALPAATSGGRRIGPANSTSPWLVLACSAFVVVGAAIPVLLLRRRAARHDPRATPGAPSF